MIHKVQNLLFYSETLFFSPIMAFEASVIVSPVRQATQYMIISNLHGCVWVNHSTQTTHVPPVLTSQNIVNIDAGAFT